jgi:UDP-3-O-[3-hydroxymyristoyl] N-acetylglucosamine deacetylase/3-hydroxyacyl-[acyl-carrier-protein] dehydratase
MVEHVMAALAGLQIDNCIVEIDGPETPGCDGSSLAFVEALTESGIVEQNRPREILVIEEPVTVREGNSILTAHPGDADKLVLTFNLDYGKHTSIGAQSFFVEVTPDNFRDELSNCRTFLLEAEAEAMRKAGIGPRTTTADILIFGKDGVIENTLRFSDEPVRHKVLDMVGDLSLIGKDIAGHVVAHRSGHSLNAALVRKLLDATEAPTAPALPVMDIVAIMKILPHRYPFLLVDRVLELEVGKTIKAIKNVTCNEPFFTGHWPDKPIMPGVMILEALAQTAGVLISQQVGHMTDPLAMIVAIDGVKIRRQVTPGDQLVMEVVKARIKEKTAHVQCRATVDGFVAAEAKIRFVFVERT